VQAEQEVIQVEQEKMQVEKTLLKSIKFFLSKGFSFNEIASELEFTEDTLHLYLSLISENENG
jgi:DNA-binding NarL/FixJ family response regulator